MLIIILLVIIFVITYVYCYKPKFRSSKTFYFSRQVQNASYFILTQPLQQSLSLCSLRGFIPGPCLRFPPLMELNGVLLWQISSAYSSDSSRIKAVSSFLEGEIQCWQKMAFQPYHRLPEALSVPAATLAQS